MQNIKNGIQTNFNNTNNTRSKTEEKSNHIFEISTVDDLNGYIVDVKQVMVESGGEDEDENQLEAYTGDGETLLGEEHILGTHIDEEAIEHDIVTEVGQEYFDENDSANMVEIRTELSDTDNHFDFIEESNSMVETHITSDTITGDDDTEQISENDIKLENAESSVTDEITMKSVFVRNGFSFMCQLCPESDEIFDVRTITTHLKSEHDARVYVCDVCGADFHKRSEMAEHLDSHLQSNEEGEFKCEICERIFKNLRLFRIHKRMHYTTLKSWTCKDCNKKYSSKNLLDEHMNMHTGERPYKCSHCTKDFASKYTLTAHMKIHTDRNRPYECKTCSKTFYSLQNLTQHERTHNAIKEYVCNMCDKAFATSHNLEVHKIVHTGFKPFICRTCGKAFARRAEIKDHERTHTGERPYNCDICGNSFAQRSNLMSHKRATHLNDKRYKCDQCEKSFKRRRLLDYHIKATHTGERPYKCDECGSTFVYPEHYKKHLRIHTGVKPFKCEVCGKAFNSRDNRNAHRFVHSDKKPYECLFCGQGFMRKPLLIAHMKVQNHENDKIVLNQPRLGIANDKNGIESNVVYINDASFEMMDNVSVV